MHLPCFFSVSKLLRRPLWLTEFACSEASSAERLPAEGQMAYMREAIPLLEQDESIEMYAWFLGAFSEHLLPKKVPASESSQVATWNIYDWHTHMSPQLPTCFFAFVFDSNSKILKICCMQKNTIIDFRNVLQLNPQNPQKRPQTLSSQVQYVWGWLGISNCGW